jgi:hypothetical protein
MEVQDKADLLCRVDFPSYSVQMVRTYVYLKKSVFGDPDPRNFLGWLDPDLVGYGTCWAG